MQLIRELNQAQVDNPTVLTIGTFDGLHRGHQTLLEQVKDAARQCQAWSAVMSFYPHPKTVLVPHLPANDYLTSADERIALFEQYGLDLLLLVPFTRGLSEISAADFMLFLKERLNLVQLWAGYDFALGKGRAGNVVRLTELGEELGYTVRQFDPALVEGQIVSSTRIRQLLTEGEVQVAADLLGRYPAATGQIGTGARRGRTIGFPTANLIIPPERLLPANGVYATWFTRLQTGQRYASVTNVGFRPSFNEQTRTVETYIFDFDEDIYDETCKVDFIDRLRPEMKFDGVEALIKQINEDAARARQLLAAMVVK